MNAELLLKYKQLDIEISLLNGALQVSAPKGVATPELKKRLVSDKSVIILALEKLKFAHNRGALPAIQPNPTNDEAAKVACADCLHFKPDTIGDGSGLGACAAMPNKQIFPLPFPHALRECGKFQKKIT
jgi:hypothetical protein